MRARDDANKHAPDRAHDRENRHPDAGDAETMPAMRYFANPSVCHSKKDRQSYENATDEAWTRFAPAGMCI